MHDVDADTPPAAPISYDCDISIQRCSIARAFLILISSRVPKWPCSQEIPHLKCLDIFGFAGRLALTSALPSCEYPSMSERISNQDLQLSFLDGDTAYLDQSFGQRGFFRFPLQRLGKPRKGQDQYTCGIFHTEY